MAASIFIPAHFFCAATEIMTAGVIFTDTYICYVGCAESSPMTAADNPLACTLTR
jgi:hypothetical protein